MKLERLRFLRRERNISQVELAKLFDVHQTAICQWENGRANPDFDKLKKIASFFGVTVDYLLQNDSEVVVGAGHADDINNAYRAAKTEASRRDLMSGSGTSEEFVSSYGDSREAKSMTDFDFALFSELNRMDEVQKQDVLNFAKFIRKRN